MCFVWISEQTAIISLYNINWLVFVTETECVYCAVRTGCLYNITLLLVQLSSVQRLLPSPVPAYRSVFSSRSPSISNINDNNNTQQILISLSLNITVLCPSTHAPAHQKTWTSSIAFHTHCHFLFNFALTLNQKRRDTAKRNLTSSNPPSQQYSQQ
jgi:hypothetical protein